MKLLLLTDICQLNDFLSKKDLLQNYMPITGDISVSFKLIQNNIPFINEWDYLNKNQIQFNWDLANDLSKIWWTGFNIDIPPEFNKYLLCTSQDMVYSLEAIFNSYEVYTSIFDKFKIIEVHGYFLHNQAVVRTGPMPTNRAVRSITQSILFWIADLKSIPIYKLETNFKLSNSFLK
jgi:hypothetical protein